MSAGLESAARSTGTYAHDLAISAVPFDAILVADLLDLVSPRLRSVTTWPGAPDDDGNGAPSMRENESRVALVLHQRLWGLDHLTRLDEAVLRQRMQHRGASVLLVLLDETRPPDWLSSDMPECDLATTGVEGIARMVLDAIVSQGGSLSAAAGPTEPSARSSSWTWPEPPAFLAQFRAHGVLRRELELLTVALRAGLRDRNAPGGLSPVEINATPNRLVGRAGEVAVSLSWLAGRGGAVSDGRLLVVEWAGVTVANHGRAALTAAEPIRERVYRAEASDELSWRWRMDSPHGRAYSSADLVGDLLSGMPIDANRRTSTPVAL